MGIDTIRERLRLFLVRHFLPVLLQFLLFQINFNFVFPAIMAQTSATILGLVMLCGLNDESLLRSVVIPADQIISGTFAALIWAVTDLVSEVLLSEFYTLYLDLYCYKPVIPEGHVHNRGRMVVYLAESFTIIVCFSGTAVLINFKTVIASETISGQSSIALGALSYSIVSRCIKANSRYYQTDVKPKKENASFTSVIKDVCLLGAAKFSDSNWVKWLVDYFTSVFYITFYTVVLSWIFANVFGEPYRYKAQATLFTTFFFVLWVHLVPEQKPDSRDSDGENST